MFRKFIFPLIIVFTIFGLLSACSTEKTEAQADTSSVDIPAVATFTPAPPTATPVPLMRPAAVMYHAVYDPVSKRVILIGFEATTTDIWAYDVASQSLTRLKDKPETYIDCLDYNTGAGGVVTNNEVTGATWLYDPVKEEWKELEKRTGGLWEDHWLCSFVYDIESGKQLAVGNFIFDYSSNSWTTTEPTSGGNWENPAMVYDSESDRILLWDYMVEKRVWAYDINTGTREMFPYTVGPEEGGMFGDAVYLPDLDRMFIYYLDQFYAYDYNSNTWEKAKGELKPGSRLKQSMAYDPVAKKIVMYGGQDENGTIIYDDLWLYDPVSGEWTQQELP